MNNLLFIALCLALIYYFFYPPKPNNANLPFKQNKAVQTEELTTDEKLKKTIQELKSDLSDYKKVAQEWREDKQKLKKQLELLSKEKKEDEKVLKTLLKEMQELTQQLN